MFSPSPLSEWRDEELLAVSFLLFLVIVTGGCAVGNKYNYRDGAVDISTSETKANFVTTYGQREYVISGFPRLVLILRPHDDWGSTVLTI